MQKNGPAPDVLTSAGNGEPTAHPHFPESIEDTLALRDHYFPNATVVHKWEKGSHKNKTLFKYHIQSAKYYFHKWGYKWI